MVPASFQPPRILPPIPSPANPEGFKGRGASANPPNRFESRWSEPDPEWVHAEDPAPGTRFVDDDTQSILTRNDSPDIGFDVSFNG